ncbi:MAG: hypothetical protein J4F36_13705 [Nitrosopumilaceae archaeon]|nr:hypothetical protein [Nitrosopumilaceae archaeon]
MKKKIDFEDLLKRQEDSANKLKEIQFGEDPYFMICVLDHWNAPDSYGRPHHLLGHQSKGR